MSVPEKQDENSTPPESPQERKKLSMASLSIFCVLAVPATIVLLDGNIVIKIAAVLVILSTLYGWVRGLSGTLSVLVALLLAFLLARPLGGMLAGPTSGIIGSNGLLNRVASIGLAGLVVFGLVSMALSIPLQRAMKNQPTWQHYDKIGGIGFGFFEGLLFALGFIWAPQALEPIASMQTGVGIASLDGAAPPPNPIADRVVWLAKKSRETAIGRSAESINPIASAPPLTMTGDFLRLAEDDESMRRFEQSDVAQRVRSMQSVERAIEILQSDEALLARIEEEGASPDVIRDLLESTTVLRILDETSIVADLAGSLEDLQNAMREALEEEETDASTSENKR